MKDIFEFKVFIDNDTFLFTDEVVDGFIKLIESKSVFWGGGGDENYIQGSLSCEEDVEIEEENLQEEVVAYFLKLNENIKIDIGKYGISKIGVNYSQCFCCGYFTVEERGNYAICPVCFWEDDGNSELTKMSGPNHMTLKEGRKNFLIFGACEKRFVKNVIKNPHDQFKNGNL
jgi:hypothetical protein